LDAIGDWLLHAPDPRFCELVHWSIDEKRYEIFSYIVMHPNLVWGMVQGHRQALELESEGDLLAD
jgi:hypothetical protein